MQRECNEGWRNCLTWWWREEQDAGHSLFITLHRDPQPPCSCRVFTDYAAQVQTYASNFNGYLIHLHAEDATDVVYSCDRNSKESLPSTFWERGLGVKSSMGKNSKRQSTFPIQPGLLCNIFIAVVGLEKACVVGRRLLLARVVWVVFRKCEGQAFSSCLGKRQGVCYRAIEKYPIRCALDPSCEMVVCALALRCTPRE
jgi:hypothetical protein